MPKQISVSWKSINFKQSKSLVLCLSSVVTVTGQVKLEIWAPKEIIEGRIQTVCNYFKIKIENRGHRGT